MGFLAELLALSDKHGLTPVVVLVVVIGGGLMLRGMVSTWNAVRLSNAEASNRTAKAEADSTAVLSQSINGLAESNNALAKAAIEGINKQFSVLTDILGQLRGGALTQSDDAKARRALSNTLNEVADRIGPIQTDLHDVSLRTAGIPSTITTLLDERLTPMLTLLINMNATVNTVAASAKANGQNVDSIILETAKINDQFSKLIVELALFKDLIFDRDDRIATIINGFNTKEKAP
jgi:hypothetical protein